MLLAVHYRVIAIGYRLGKLLRFFRALQTSRMLHNSIVHAMLCYETTAVMKQQLNGS